MRWRESPGYLPGPHDPCVSSQILKNLGMLPPPAQQWLSWRFVFWVEISEKIYRHPGDGIYTPSKWWHYVTCHESTGQGLHIHPWIFQAFMLHCLSQLGGPITTEIHWAMNPLRPSKTIAFCEVLIGVCPLPPKKKERLPHLTASWQLPWHTNSYKHVFSRRQVTSSRRQGPHRVTVESDQKGPKKMNGFSNNCMGTGISQETRLPHLKAPGKPEQSNNQGLHRSAHVFAEGPLRLFGASPPENLSKTMSESFFGQPPTCFCHYSMEIYKSWSQPYHVTHRRDSHAQRSKVRIRGMRPEFQYW